MKNISQVLTEGILEDIKMTESEYSFDTDTFSSDIDSEFFKTEEEMFFEIGVISYLVNVKITHTWGKVHNGGDGFNEPSEYEAENEHSEIEIKGLFVDGDKMDFKELEGELTSHIYDKYIK
jgi:hypothetical protein